MKLFFLLLGCCFWMKVDAQIWSDPVTGSQPGNSQGFQSSSGTIINSNITVSGISKGSGLNGNNANDRYAADQWNLSSFDANDYFTFTLTPKVNNPNYQFYFSDFTYTGQVSATGPINFVFRSSLDGFSSNIGIPSGAGTTIDLSNISFQRLTNSIEFRLFAWGGSNNNGTFSINQFSFNGYVKLPIQLAFFDVKLQDKKPLISWTTYSETNNHHYVIQRSQDGQSFADIATYKGIGTGTSDHELTYSHVDQSANSGKNYYRLKQVDLDGTSSVFPVRSVIVVTKVMKVYPSLVKSELYLEIPGQDRWRWSLTDLSGHICDKGYEINSAGIITLPLEHLSNGFYVITLSSLEDRRSFKFIKL